MTVGESSDGGGGKGAEVSPPIESVPMQTLGEIWTEILGVDHIRGNDTFAELGGSSLDMVRLLSVVQQRLSVRLAVSDVIAEPTLARMAGVLEQKSASVFGSAGSIMARVRSAQRGTDGKEELPLFCFAGSGGSVWSFLPLASELRPGPAVYAIQQRGLEHRALPHWRLKALVNRAIREIRVVQPRGPYRLLGHSMGGVAALEAARALDKDGEKVEFVLLLDITLPSRTARVLEAEVPAPARHDAQRCASGDRSRTILQRSALYARLLTAGLVRLPLGAQQEIFYELGLRVQNRHLLRPWDGRAVVVVTADTVRQEAGLRKILVGDVDVHRVQGDHMSVVREGSTNVAVAEILATELGKSLGS